MEASLRPWFTTGVALVGAGAIALTPVTPMAPPRPAMDLAEMGAAVSREYQLTAIDWPYVLSLPIIRQYVVNGFQNFGVFLGGFAQSGVGLVQSLLSIPGVTIEAIQQVLALDFVGAFETITTAVRDSVVAVGEPLLDSIIWRAQKADLVQAALQAATPAALIAIANGFLAAGNGVTTSLIVGTQNLVAAILTLNLGNIVNAALDGTRNFVVALGAGAVAIVDGIEAAQVGISTALATQPPPPPTFGVADVVGLSTLSSENTVSLNRSARVTTLDEGTSTSDVTDPVEPAPDPEPLPQTEETRVPEVSDSPVKVEPKAPAATDPTPAKDASDEAGPTDSPKKPYDPASGRDTLKPAVKAAPADKDAGDVKDAGPKDAPNDAKPAKDPAGE